MLTSRKIDLALISLAVFGAVSVFLLRTPIFESDLGYHLKTGEFIVKNAQIPMKDIFSWTADGSRWIVHYWLSDVIFYIVYSAWGLLGLKWLIVILGGISYSLAFVASYLKSKSYLLPLIFLSLFFAIDHYYLNTVRPQIFTYFFFSILVLVLAVGKQRPKILKILPLVFLIWANLHAQFLLGLVYWAISSKDKKEWGLFALSVLATFINPNLYLAHIYSFITLGQTNLLSIIEWKSILSFLNIVEIQILLLTGLTCFAFIIAIQKKKLIKDGEFWASVLFFLFPISGVRMISFLPFVLVPYFSKNLQVVLEKIFQHKKLIIDTLGGLVVLFALVLVAVTKTKTPVLLDLTKKPVGAAAFIEKSGLTGKMFNDFADGAYLLWRLQGTKVFIDGRYDPFLEQGVISDYSDIDNARDNWFELADHKYGVDFYLVRHSQLDFLNLGKERFIFKELSADYEHFALVYMDDYFMIFVRRDPKNSAFIDLYEIKELQYRTSLPKQKATSQ